jgi:sulfur carrier protein ThiS
MKINYENKDSTIKFTGNVKQLLKQLNINEETVLVIKDNQVLTTDIQLEDKDTIQILSVISGG